MSGTFNIQAHPPEEPKIKETASTLLRLESDRLTLAELTELVSKARAKKYSPDSTVQLYQGGLGYSTVTIIDSSKEI